MSTNGNGKMKSSGKRPRRRAGNAEYDPTVWLFLMQLAVNRGNVAAAAAATGWSSSAADRFVKAHPELRQLVDEFVFSLSESTMMDWREMHAQARRRVQDLMYSEDDRVALAAAQVVIERVEGKVTIPIQDETPRVSLDSIHMRFVAALHLYKGYSVAEALEYARRHPEEVEEWGKAKGLLPGEVFDA